MAVSHNKNEIFFLPKEVLAVAACIVGSVQLYAALQHTNTEDVFVFTEMRPSEAVEIGHCPYIFILAFRKMVQQRDTVLFNLFICCYF